ncbi:hypothetical protein LV83_02517 [Algoriphagus yeomjeoni]|uniref:Uncharacterized protein n=1 Tax=Algoriphagus yeomjeoni TaxID=291403 RepID=A0A327PB46_9BACT|nr:hypothetical protein LV83_02517 [Algoriphagus yeomjeoni]
MHIPLNRNDQLESAGHFFVLYQKHCITSGVKFGLSPLIKQKNNVN